MNENQPEGKKNKALPIIIAIIAVLVLALIVVLAISKTSEKTPAPNNQEVGEMMDEGDMPPIDDDMMAEEIMEDGEEKVLTVEEERLETAVEVVKGGNLISEDNIVITNTGEETRTDVKSSDPLAPKQTKPLEETELSAEVIKITMSAGSIEPAEFTVKAGEAVSIAVTSADKSHVFKFKDPILKAVGIGIMGGETRGITFNAPETPGRYEIFCDIPGHEARGEASVMIVE